MIATPLPEYDYATGRAICRECGCADYLHVLACTVLLSTIGGEAARASA